MREPINMFVTCTFVTACTRRDDVEFSKTQLMTATQTREYVLAVSQNALIKGITILEFEVFRDGIRIWRGLL